MGCMPKRFSSNNPQSIFKRIINMGLGIMSMSGSHGSSAPEEGFTEIKPKYNLGGPQPRRFNIIDTLSIGKYLIVTINYPDCKNYEGNKILVYENIN